MAFDCLLGNKLSFSISITCPDPLGYALSDGSNFVDRKRALKLIAALSLGINSLTPSNNGAGPILANSNVCPQAQLIENSAIAPKAPRIALSAFLCLGEVYIFRKL